jgi:hypothetical protein
LIRFCYYASGPKWYHRYGGDKFKNNNYGTDQYLPDFWRRKSDRGSVAGGGGTVLMGGHSILYLGRDEFAAGFLEILRASPACEDLTQSDSFVLPQTLNGRTDLVLLEAGPALAQSGQTLPTLLHSLRLYPVIALTTRDREHRGIAALRGLRENQEGADLRRRNWSPFGIGLSPGCDCAPSWPNA